MFSIDEFGRRLARDFESYSQFKDLPGSRNPNDLPLVQSNQRIVGGGLFTMLDGGMRYRKELANIHDPMLSRSEKLFGQGGKIRLSDIVVALLDFRLDGVARDNVQELTTSLLQNLYLITPAR